MTCKTAADFPPEVLKLFDLFVHGFIDRRGFLNGAKRFSVGASGGAAFLEALSPRFAVAQQVKPDDPRIKGKTLEAPSPEGYGTVKGYFVQPSNASGKLPTILVIHENRGLNPHIEDIARRLALDNFIAFAPDALAPLGGYPGDEDKARELFTKLEQTKTRNDFLVAFDVLKHMPDRQRQGRRRGLLLWRRDRELPCDEAPGSRRGRFLLRRGAAFGRRSQDQGAAASPVRRRGRAHQRRLARL